MNVSDVASYQTEPIPAVGTVLATSVFAQSAKDIRGANPYIEIPNEPAPS